MILPLMFDFIYGLVRLFKPKLAIDSGAEVGGYAVAIGSAIRDNGFGKLHRVEADPEAAKRALTEIENARLRDWVEIVVQQDLTFEPSNELEFALFTSGNGSGIEEFLRLYEKLAPGATVIFYDAFTQGDGSEKTISELICQGRLAGSFFETPRGLFVGSVRKPPEVTFSFGQPDLHRVATNSSLRERNAILILGMHRSGTSALARVLNMLGAGLPERLVGPEQGNPLGHWEPEELNEIDGEILHAMGRTWDDPRQIPSAWFRSKTAYSFHERLRGVILTEYGDAPLVVIKEPRICRLAPLYLDVLDTLGIKAYVILPVRHPAEVIRSISERDQLDPAAIELLWLRHILEAETASRMCRRVWTSYEQLLGQWEMTVQSIASGLNITWPADLEEAGPAIQEFLRPRHHHHKAENDPNPPFLGEFTMRAWNAIQRAMNGEEGAAQAIFDEINTTFREVDRLNFPSEELIQKRLLALESERNDFRDHLASSETKLSAVSAGLAEADAKLAELNKKLAEAEEKLARSNGELAQTDKKLAEANERLAELRTNEIAHAEEINRLSVIAEQKLKVEADLCQANDQIASLNNAVENLNSRISSMLASRSWQITAPFRVVQRWVLRR